MSNQFLKLRRSGVPGKIPTTESIDFGEIALNTFDGKAYMKVSGSDGIKVVPIGSNSGSFTGSFLGNLIGTASWAENALTASYLINAKEFYYTGSAPSGSFITTGSLWIDSDTGYMFAYIDDGSDKIWIQPTIEGSQGQQGPIGPSGSQGAAGPTGSSAPFAFIGNNTWNTTSSLEVSGSFLVSGSSTFTNIGPGVFSGSVVVLEGVTGSLYGTSSWAESSSFAITASYALNIPEIDFSSLVTTSSFNAFTSSYNTGSFAGTFNGDLIGTASYVNLLAGPGITINGLEITSSVRTVNGIFPTDGNIPISLSATVTGTSASLVSSGSGNITASIADGLVWIISNDATPENNGDVYIYSSGSVGAWYQVAPLDQAASDARYIKLDGANTPMTGDLNMGGNNINNVGNMNGTASFATSASFAVSASWAPFVATDTGSLLLTSSFNAFTSSYNTGSFTGSFTGGLIGTSSWSNNATTASYVLNAVSASFASTASFVQIAQTASYVLNAVTASHLIGYLQDSASFDQRINNIRFDTSSLPSPAVTVDVATTAALPGTPVYNNGIGGIGAFISSSVNSSIGAIDGVTVFVGDRILVKNQATQLQNGVYDVISTGSASTRYIISRSSDSNETSELDSQIVIPSFGSTNAGGIFAQNTNNPIVGTSNIVYIRQTSTLVTQNTAGTQAIYQIPWWTGTARDLSRGSTHFRYINVTSGTTVTTSSLQLTGSFNLSGSAFVRGLTSASQTNVLTYDSSTGQIFFTASSAIGGGGGGSTPTGSLLTTASVSSNTITFTKGDGSTFPITVNTGSGGGSGLSGGTQYYVPVWTGATTLGTSSLYESGSVLKTISESSDVGLKLDFANQQFYLGVDPNGGDAWGLKVERLFSSLGDYGEGDNGTTLKVDASNQLINTSNAGNDIGLKLDFANKKYNLGEGSDLSQGFTKGILVTLSNNNPVIFIGDTDADVPGNGTRLTVNDLSSTIESQYQGFDIGLKLDFANNYYWLGNLLGGNNTSIFISDAAKGIDISALDSIGIGDAQGIFNATLLTVNDTGSYIKTSYQYNDIGLKLDFANNIYDFGDENNARVLIENSNSFIELVAGTTNSTLFRIDDNFQIIKTRNRGNEIGLKLDFASASYSLGDYNNISGSTKLVIDDNARTVTVSGSTVLSGSLFVNNLTTGSTSNVLTYDTTTGQVFITASSAIGGGGSGIPGGSDTQIQFNSGSTFSGSAAFRFIYASQSLEQGFGVQAIGQYSFAQGGNPSALSSPTALGTGSHAEGDETIASGDYSHAEGQLTVASGLYSHAEGSNTQAIGSYTHAEGETTQAIGNFSHAEGNVTMAIGLYSHAEGASAIAIGYGSHAEGNATKTGTQNAYSASISASVITLDSASLGDVSGEFFAGSYLYAYVLVNNGERYLYTISSSFYDGTNTIVTIFEDSTLTDEQLYVGDLGYGIINWTGNQITPGDYSHAEGSNSQAIGFSSHAEGQEGFSIGNYSHAEGQYTEAIGLASHAEGVGTQAIGEYSHAEGYNTRAVGYASHAEGRDTIASGSYSHAAGYFTIASGDYQSVIGQYNISSSAQSAFIIGNGTNNANRSNLLFASGSQVQITGSLLISGSTNAAQITNGWVVLSQVSMSLDFANDAAAAAGGVPLGGLYRNGNAISIRIA